MPDQSTVILFVIAAVALLLIPGPMVLYTVTRSISQGRQAGLVSVLAAGVGDMCHVVAAAVGLSAILLTSALAFSVVKYVGAAYLIYLGLRTLAQRDQVIDGIVGAPIEFSRVFSQGILVSVLNPKTALFFLAFFPQFVDPSRGTATLQILFLGVLFVTLGICTNMCYALLASVVGGRIQTNAAFLRHQRYFAGSMYIVLGISTALIGTEISE